MKRFFTFIFLFVFLSAATFAQEFGKQKLDRNGYPTFVKFDTKTKSVSKSETKAMLSGILNMTKSDEYKTLRSEKDQIGYTHERFQQYFKGIKVENGIYIAHSRNKVIESLSGEYKLIDDINIAPSVSSEKAVENAKAFINAQEYMTEDEVSVSAPELVIVAHDFGKHPKDKYEMVLAYKIDIYAVKPLSRDYIYVNAHSGEIVHVNAIIKTANETGSADTRYSGTKSISTDSYNSSYRLRDYSRGDGIITYNCNEGTSYTNAVDFTDADNNWTAAEYDNADKDNGALDAHWAGMMTYDYFNTVHGRNSFDGNGALMKTYVHYDSNYENAYWNGSVFTFGDGASTFDILTSLDVFGHEFGHAVCSYTCDLTYSREPGALNEAFSDIWGCAIEYKYAPDKDTWFMGEDLGYVLRDISNPKAKGLPDTYLGTNWVTSSSDYYGVHTNNGPFCYWFYLISEGGSGTNDNNDTYSVTGIGIEKAEQIAYRIESVYMTASSQYADARTFAIQAAQDLYGTGSQEEISVTNAMYGIGVGDAYGNVPSAAYCESKGSNFSYEWIAQVELGTFTNTSTGAAYSDFTSSTINVNAGETYNLTLTPGFASTTYNEYWKIWIDYNNDTIFDANELAYDCGALSKVAVTGTITIPSDITGVRRMRISMKYDGTQTACETFSYGEVEDYNITIASVTPDTEAPTAPTNLTSSNITETTVTLSWTASTDNIGVTGYDVYQNGSLLASTANTTYNVTGLTASTSYTFYVKAKDAAENVSNASTTINVTTDTPFVDTEAPTIPTGLASSNITETSFTLSWTASTDNVGVTGYDVYQDGSLVVSVTGTSTSITGLTASTTYAMTIKAKDAAENISSASNALNVTTSDPAGTGCTGGINSFPYSEGFESGIGDWTQDSNDDLDWSVDASGTPSSSTGPSSADEGTYYMYVEASSPNYPSKVAILNSPCLDLAAEINVDFNFAYHMYGSSMGTLELQASIDGTSWNTLWTKSGDQGNSWYNASVSLNSYIGTSVQLRYVATTGSSYRSDMAIDDISVTNGSTPTGTDLTLTITFDNYPEETSWTLKNSAGSTVASGGTYASQADGSTLVIPINDLVDDCYDFTILDTYGDGICCAYGNGSYTLEVTGGTELASGGSFGSSEVTNFCLPSTAYNFANTGKNDVLDNVINNSAVNIYPNPASTFINVNVTNGARVGIINIYNMVGALVKTLEINGSEKEINISELPSGSYIISIEDVKEPIVKQFIKK